MGLLQFVSRNEERAGCRWIYIWVGWATCLQELRPSCILAERPYFYCCTNLPVGQATTKIKALTPFVFILAKQGDHGRDLETHFCLIRDLLKWKLSSSIS